MKMLMVVTSHSAIAQDHTTGVWLEEFTVPYLEFKAVGLDVTVASIKGGKPPVDPRSLPTMEQAEAWLPAVAALEQTVPIAQVNDADFVAVFLPGGHGTMFDLPENPYLQKLLSNMASAGKIIAAVCHGPAGLLRVIGASKQLLVAGRRITGFTNDEERTAGMDKKMPFLLETSLCESGAKFVGKPIWADHVEVDGNLITGQNPQSSRSTAKAVIGAVRAVAKAS